MNLNRKYTEDEEVKILERDVTQFFNNFAKRGVLDYVLWSENPEPLEMVKENLEGKIIGSYQYVCGKVYGRGKPHPDLNFKPFQNHSTTFELKISLDKL